MAADKRIDKDPAKLRSELTRTLEVLHDEEPAEPTRCMVFVSRADPQDRGLLVAFDGPEMLIGRDESCDLTLVDNSVSRMHAKLTATPGGIVVQDLGSTNGVTYLGKKIGKATLPVGSQVGIGSCIIELLPLPDTPGEQLSTRDQYGDLVGTSLPMRRLYTTLEKLEHSDAPVLLEGETGTGKELVARALHRYGPRKDKPLLVVDCGNVPAYLMESELFGHRKGSFTGAVSDRTGVFESANNGTVFLDELGELPLELQPKLLRVLETGEVKQIGDVKHVPVDVRVIAATQRDLATEVSAGRFREDLYYRVAVVQLRLPPLREKREDIIILANHLASRLSGGQFKSLPKEAEEFIFHHDWPGNVRELRNVVQRIMALGTADLEFFHQPSTTTHQATAAHNGQPAGFREARNQLIEDFERNYVQDLFTRFEGNLSAAARAAGIDRKHLRKLLKKYGVI